jgi:hypothetical protein
LRNCEEIVKSKFSLLFLFIFLFNAAAQTSAPANFDGKSWWDLVKLLASDDMEGRETGSPGLAKAAANIVDQVKKDGRGGDASSPGKRYPSRSTADSPVVR